MFNHLSLLGNRVLREICIPGSHDSGMSVFGNSTLLAAPCNTVTQSYNIENQLNAGARYFDIRPVISSGKYFTGHYSEFTIAGINTWQGANGQSIDSIIAQLNAFTSKTSELIILNLSHDLNTDTGNNNYRHFTQVEWDILLNKLRDEVQHLFIHTTHDLTMLSLNEFIADGSSAVVIIVEPGDGDIKLGDYTSSGIYPAASFPVYNSYANTSDINTMITDQLTKLNSQKPTPLASYFLLSWTLTQNTLQAATCQTGLANSIKTNAVAANNRLDSRLIPVCTAQCFPNIVYVDNITDTPDLVSIAMEINNL
jgi:hypothetical protein